MEPADPTPGPGFLRPGRRAADSPEDRLRRPDRITGLWSGGRPARKPGPVDVRLAQEIRQDCRRARAMTLFFPVPEKEASAYPGDIAARAGSTTERSRVATRPAPAWVRVGVRDLGQGQPGEPAWCRTMHPIRAKLNSP